MPTVLGVHLILVFVAIGQEGAAVAAAAPACTTFLNTDFNGHDLHAAWAWKPRRVLLTLQSHARLWILDLHARWGGVLHEDQRYREEAVAAQRC